MSVCRWLAAALFVCAAQAANTQYNITTLLLEGGKIPGSENTWNVNPGLVPTMPLSISGNYVAFVQCTCDGTTQTTDGVWIDDWSTATFTQLVAPGAVPAGKKESAITSFGGYALVAGEWVVFLAYTSGGEGFYSVPLTGGAVRPIVDQNTVLPELGAPALGYSFGNYTGDFPQSDGQHFVFWANAGFPYGSGVFSANLNGTGLAAIAYTTTIDNVLSGDLVIPTGLPCTDTPASQYVQPRVAGSNVAFPGATNNGKGPWLFVTPLSGFPSGDTCSPSGYIVYPATVAYNTPLPPAEPTTEGFDGQYLAIDSLGNEYFSASGDGSAALFEVNAKGITPILNSTEPLPGISPPYAPAGGTQGIAAYNGTLAFSVAGEYGLGITQNAGLFAYNGGNITKVALGSGAGTNDILGGLQAFSWAPPVGPNSIDGGRVVFSTGNPAKGWGVFLASPASCAADVTSQTTVTQTPPHYNSTTQQYTSKVTVKNVSGTILAAPVSAVFDGLTNVVANYGTTIPELLQSGAGPVPGATACLSPLGEAYLVLNGGKALAAGAEVSLELTIAYPAPPATFSYTTRVVTGKTR